MRRLLASGRPPRGSHSPPAINETHCRAPQVNEFLKWLKEQEAAQAKKAAHEEPAFESAVVALRWELAAKAFERLNNKRKPRPPPDAVKVNATAGAGPEGGEGQQQEADGKGGSGEEEAATGEGQQQKEGAEAEQRQGEAGGGESGEEDQHTEL